MNTRSLRVTQTLPSLATLRAQSAAASTKAIIAAGRANDPGAAYDAEMAKPAASTPKRARSARSKH
jgi:hypothetical protein